MRLYFKALILKYIFYALPCVGETLRALNGFRLYYKPHGNVWSAQEQRRRCDVTSDCKCFLKRRDLCPPSGWH